MEVLCCYEEDDVRNGKEYGWYGFCWDGRERN